LGALWPLRDASKSGCQEQSASEEHPVWRCRSHREVRTDSLGWCIGNETGDWRARACICNIRLDQGLLLARCLDSRPVQVAHLNAR